MTLEQAIDGYTNNAEYERIHGSLQGCMEFRQLAEWLKDYKQLKEQQPCDDAISRILKRMWNYRGKHTTSIDKVAMEQIIRDEMPSITPKPETVTEFADRCRECGARYGKLLKQKSGTWIDYSDDGFVECPFCGHATNCEDNIDELHYCFYCGARMVEPQERKVRE